MLKFTVTTTSTALSKLLTPEQLAKIKKSSGDSKETSFLLQVVGTESAINIAFESEATLTGGIIYPGNELAFTYKSLEQIFLIAETENPDIRLITN